MATRRDETVNVKKKAAGTAKPAAAGKAARRKPAARKSSPRARSADAAFKKAAGAAKTSATPKTAKTPKMAKAEQVPAKPGLLRAGLAALGNVRDDVVKRQGNVIENLLGIGARPGKGDAPGAAPARGFPGLDSFGIRKFEDVFDQRVATALQRLGMPSAQEIQELREQMRLLLEHLERVEPGRRRR